MYAYLVYFFLKLQIFVVLKRRIFYLSPLVKILLPGFFLVMSFEMLNRVHRPVSDWLKSVPKQGPAKNRSRVYSTFIFFFTVIRFWKRFPFLFSGRRKINVTVYTITSNHMVRLSNGHWLSHSMQNKWAALFARWHFSLLTKPNRTTDKTIAMLLAFSTFCILNVCEIDFSVWLCLVNKYLGHFVFNRFFSVSGHVLNCTSEVHV